MLSKKRTRPAKENQRHLMIFAISEAEGIYLYEVKRYVLEWNLFHMLFGI